MKNPLLDAANISAVSNDCKLSILFGDNRNCVWAPSVYFNNTYDESWFADKFIIDLVSKIDNSFIEGSLVQSPVLGTIKVEDLSGGVKACILMYKTDNVICASSCGDNCIPIIESILRRKHLQINLCHWMEFSDNVYPIKVLNSGVVCYNRESLYSEYIKYAC